jgi:hypothetical protein
MRDSILKAYYIVMVALILLLASLTIGVLVSDVPEQVSEIPENLVAVTSAGQVVGVLPSSIVVGLYVLKAITCIVGAVALVIIAKK